MEWLTEAGLGLDNNTLRLERTTQEWVDVGGRLRDHLAAEDDLQPVHESLVGAGWIYRGDAGESGGHVFVLESKPGRSVAHAHVVDHQGEQWLN